MTTPQLIALTEYQTKTLAQTTFPETAARLLHQYYSQQVALKPPSFMNNHHWELTAQGWVGHLSLTSEVALILQPKVPLGNLFRMLEYAYSLESFRLLEGLIDSQSLIELYERLAHILAQRILERGRRGLYRAFLSRQERLPYLRGRLNVRQTVQAPGQVKLACGYEEQTADIEDNQILAWTLFRIARSGLPLERSLPTVQKAYRLLQGTVTLTDYPAEACLGRHYNRLSEDYQPLHALCHFFLDHSGPSHQMGRRRMIPFLVSMERLFEKFVAEWLVAHLPPHLKLQAQEKIDIDTEGKLSFRADLVIYEVATGLPLWVLDTKYKAADVPATEDISQVTAYAAFKRCPEAILIYPSPLRRPLDTRRDTIRVRSLTFALDDDLETAGQQFLQTLLEQPVISY